MVAKKMSKKQYTKIKENVYTAKENFVSKIDEFFLAISVDENGNEGVVAQVDLTSFHLCEKPLMGASKSDKEAILEAADKLSKQHEVKIKVLRFTHVETIAEF